MVTEQEIREALKTVYDPEISINVVDLGLIYDIEIKETPSGIDVHITMTLTGPGCPIGPYLQSIVSQTVKNISGVKNAAVDIVFDPPWDPHTMATEEGKEALGIF